MSRPRESRAAPALWPDTVVYALPSPIPDPASAAATMVAAAVAAPAVAPSASSAGAPEPIVARRASTQAPSAAAIQAAAASRPAAALRAPMALSGGWTLANRDEAARSDQAAADGPLGLGAAPTTRKQKGGKAQLAVRDGRSFGEQGRFYLYAGVKNRGVGLNLTDHNGDGAGGWGSDGVSYDRGGFAGQRSAGVGWRQGDVATSLGWVHEKNNIKGMYGAPAEKDDRVALTFSWRPSLKRSAPRAEP